MAKKKKGFLPKLEILIILVFFFSFIAWAMSKCNAKKLLYQDETPAETKVEQPETATLPADTAVAVQPAATSPAPPPTASTLPPERVTPLYVTIDGLNLRSEPSLEGEVIARLQLFEEVIFLNEVTDSTYQISLGYEIADEPWVKVRHRRGHEGWVYGAGVSYYKKKREGVLE